jgi:hypothetical protein
VWTENGIGEVTLTSIYTLEDGVARVVAKVWEIGAAIEVGIIKSIKYPKEFQTIREAKEWVDERMNVLLRVAFPLEPGTEGDKFAYKEYQVLQKYLDKINKYLGIKDVDEYNAEVEDFNKTIDSINVRYKEIFNQLKVLVDAIEAFNKDPSKETYDSFKKTLKLINMGEVERLREDVGKAYEIALRLEREGETLIAAIDDIDSVAVAITVVEPKEKKTSGLLNKLFGLLGKFKRFFGIALEAKNSENETAIRMINEAIKDPNVRYHHYYIDDPVNIRDEKVKDLYGIDFIEDDKFFHDYTPDQQEKMLTWVKYTHDLYRNQVKLTPKYGDELKKEGAKLYAESIKAIGKLLKIIFP